MAENELVSTGDLPESEVSGKLRKNNLSSDDDFYVQLDKKLVTVKMTMRSIKDDNKGVDTGRMSHYLEVYQDKILSFLRQGFSVKILDLVTLYPALQGNVKNSTEAKTQGKFTVRSTVSQIVLDSVKDLTLSDVESAQYLIEITSVKGLESDDGSVVAGSALGVAGENIKVGGDGSGVYLMKASEDGTVSADRTTWIKIPKLLRNVPKELMFNVPRDVSAGKYSLRIETRFSNGKCERKEILVCTSTLFDIKA